MLGRLGCGHLWPVIIEIHVPEALSFKRKPFADISAFSEFDTEQEILFDLGTIFQITSVSHPADYKNLMAWTIRLTLADAESELPDMLESIRNEYSNGGEPIEGAHLLHFSIALLYWHKTEIANKLLKRMVNKYSHTNTLHLAAGFHYLARTEYLMSKYKTGLVYHE